MIEPHEWAHPAFHPLRNVPYPGDPHDLDLCALFASERGARVLARFRQGGAPLMFLASEVDAAVARVRAHCSTGSLTPS